MNFNRQSHGGQVTAPGSLIARNAKAALIAAFTLAGVGAALQPVASAIHPDKTLPVVKSVWNARLHLPAPGPGLSLALLGGWRSWVADLLWLKAYTAWAHRDRFATEALLKMVSIVDERPVYFWLNGARMIAYDITSWRLHVADTSSILPAAVRRKIMEEQAGLALRHLEHARVAYPDSAAICVEIANLHLNLRADVGAAAEWYRRAAELPDAPWYAGRIHAELLKRMGRRREAYGWLCQLHPRLPPNNEAAMAEVVLERIRELEKTLEVPVESRYKVQPSRQSSSATKE